MNRPFSAWPDWAFSVGFAVFFLVLHGGLYVCLSPASWSSLPSFLTDPLLVIPSIALLAGLIHACLQEADGISDARPRNWARSRHQARGLQLLLAGLVVGLAAACLLHRVVDMPLDLEQIAACAFLGMFAAWFGILGWIGKGL